jgi:hypothetical protein
VSILHDGDDNDDDATDATYIEVAAASSALLSAPATITYSAFAALSLVLL